MTRPPHRPLPRQPLGPRLSLLAALLLLVAGIGFTWRPGDARPASSSTTAPAGTEARRSPPAAPSSAPGPREPSPDSEPPPSANPSEGEPLEAPLLEGTVVDEAGRPVAGAELYLHQLDPAEPGDLGSGDRRTLVHSAHSGEDGTFLLEARRPGPMASPCTTPASSRLRCP